ncbi:MAG: GAF domain-containing protein [Bacteroidales bacterium]|nr:GAF domain-containing protein [Bacteroidales bacterium]
MKINFHLSLRFKIVLGIMLVFLVFIGIGVFSLITNYEQKNTSLQLKDNIQIQNGLNNIKNIVFKDFQISDELVEKYSESELEAKWKEHEVLVDEVNLIFSEFENLSLENVDINGLVSIYRKQVLEPYYELHRKKLKQVILIDTDSSTKDVSMVQNEIDDVRRELKNNINILNVKINKSEEVVKENLSNLIHLQYSEFKKHHNWLIMMNIIAFIGLLLYVIALMSILLKSLSKLGKYVKKLETGIIPEKLTISSKDEVGEMANGLYKFATNVKDISVALDEIGDNQFENKYTPLSNDDELGHSFKKMKQSLITRNEEAKKMKEQEDIQNWATIGIAKFGEILRLQTKNNEELSYNILKALIEYVDANQGGIFIVNDEDGREPVLELMATFAYGRKKFKQRSIKFGEGLIGTTALEGLSTHITNLPNDYIEIESYLGHANPKSLLLVPLKVDNRIFGVIELASFNEFRTHVIKFIEDLAETIASTLATAKINAKTAELLEKSKQQSEAMLAQEEEMRQNLEELQSTQEEAARRERILQDELKNAEVEIDQLRKEMNNLKKK